MGQKCGIKGGLVYIYLMKNGRWQSQNGEDTVIAGSDYNFVFIRDVLLIDSEKERLTRIETEKDMMRNIQCIRRIQNMALLPECL